MVKKVSTSLVFFLFCFVFSILLFHSQSEAILSGVIYSFVYAFRFHRDISVKALFPLIMLFIFLLVLTEAPERAYTLTLVYTVRLLILFRGLMLILNQIQNSETKVPKTEFIFILGTTIELGLVGILLYSTFKVLGFQFLQTVHFLSVKLFLLFSGPLIYQRLSSKHEQTHS